MTRPDPENDEPSPKQGNTRLTHHLVGLKLMGPLSKEIPMVEFRSIWDAIKLRWWIVPLCMIIGAGLMYSQKSSTPATPQSTILSKVYGGRDEISGLAVFGIAPSSVQEFPSFQNQLSLVNPETEVGVQVKLAEPRVSMVATNSGEGQQYFTLTSSGVPNYDFTCMAPERQPCDDAIDIYVQAVQQIRAESVKAGLLTLANQIEAVINAGSTEQPTLESQLVAINSAINETAGQLQFVREDVETVGGPASAITFSTYLFGIVAGFIVSILIILQLNMTDNRIRRIGKLKKIEGGLFCLGEIRLTTKTIDATHVTASIVKAVQSSSTQGIVVMPIGGDVASTQTLSALNEAGLAAYVTSSLQGNIDSISIQDLISNNSPFVLVAQRNISTTQQLSHTYETLTRTGNLVLGVILTSLN